jgi:hypothetical protein
MTLGIVAPTMTLMLHLIFGVVRGWVYGLERPEPTASSKSRVGRQDCRG